ncbi:hypothetical protein B0E41_16440 [Hydrogenophaga sp. A37]|nr:hypothetical protein B0E41_16440 [Hydrogenophaga sp. A37]
MLCALLLLSGLTAGALAQSVSEHAVKAGFVANFIKFTQWPGGGDAANAPLRLCSTGSQALQGQLALLQGRAVGGRVLEIVPGAVSTHGRQCDVLFLAEGDAHRLETLLRGLGNAPVLTVGDLPGFVQAGGMIGLRIEASRVRFDVNLAAAQRAGLLLNSQMLKLAGKVLQ